VVVVVAQVALVLLLQTAARAVTVLLSLDINSNKN
jgi:hypothetical protein